MGMILHGDHAVRILDRAAHKGQIVGLAFFHICAQHSRTALFVLLIAVFIIRIVCNQNSTVNAVGHTEFIEFCLRSGHGCEHQPMIFAGLKSHSQLVTIMQLINSVGSRSRLGGQTDAAYGGKYQ